MWTAKRGHGYIVREFESSKHLSPRKLGRFADGTLKHETAPEGGFADRCEPETRNVSLTIARDVIARGAISDRTGRCFLWTESTR